MIYAQQDKTLFVNLFISNKTDVNLGNQKFRISQETNYPWDGQVKFTVNPESSAKFTLKIRVPGWSRNEVLPGGLYHFSNTTKNQATLFINNKKSDVKVTDGYFTISRSWKKGDNVIVNFPMETRVVVASEKITDDNGKVALERGPLVYALEQVDNRDLQSISINHNTSFSVESKPDMLNGIYTITGKTGEKTFTAIPYYSWSNRGVNEMKVWIKNTGNDLKTFNLNQSIFKKVNE